MFSEGNVGPDGSVMCGIVCYATLRPLRTRPLGRKHRRIRAMPPPHTRLSIPWHTHIHNLPRARQQQQQRQQQTAAAASATWVITSGGRVKWVPSPSPWCGCLVGVWGGRGAAGSSSRLGRRVILRALSFGCHNNGSRIITNCSGSGRSQQWQ